jgi:hypothetical protein
LVDEVPADVEAPVLPVVVVVVVVVGAAVWLPVGFFLTASSSAFS